MNNKNLTKSKIEGNAKLELCRQKRSLIKERIVADNEQRKVTTNK